jgi:hypothetical protein
MKDESMTEDQGDFPFARLKGVTFATRFSLAWLLSAAIVSAKR